MPPVQDTYREQISAARAGMMANMEHKRLVSRHVETEPGIEFGTFVQAGTAEKTCKSDLAGLNASTMLGVVVRERGIRPTYPNGYATIDSARVMMEGCIWVKVGAAAVVHDTPAAVSTVDGSFGNVGGANMFAIPGARWDTSAAAGALAVLRLG